VTKMSQLFVDLLQLFSIFHPEMSKLVLFVMMTLGRNHHVHENVTGKTRR